jgi:prepilin-type N-terminal cleavage/methylation domain-containing protein
MAVDSEKSDKSLPALAEEQYGYFTAAQAREAGYATPNHYYHVKQGNWQKIDRGIFRLPGYADSIEAEYARWSLWARTRHGECCSTISHRSALFCHGLLKNPPEVVEITVPPEFQKKEHPENILIHVDRLAESERIRRTGFWVTTRERTLLDTDSKSTDYAEKHETSDLATEYTEYNAPQIRGQTQGVITSPGRGGIIAPFLLGRCTECEELARENNTESEDLVNADRHEVWREERRGHFGFGSRAAFTLVELLVVIAIISILASLLLPTLSKAREQARKIECLNKMRQIGFCLRQYLDDCRGQFFPYTPDGSGGWFSFNKNAFGGSYLGVPYIWPVPADGDHWKNTLLDCPTNDSGYNGKSIDYAYNNSLAVNVSTLPWGRLSRIKKPSHTVAFADTRGKGQAIAANGYYYFESKWGTKYYDAINYDLHGGTPSHVFLDGHVASATQGAAENDFVFTPDDE